MDTYLNVWSKMTNKTKYKNDTHHCVASTGT